jgi:hypothetical protein
MPLGGAMKRFLFFVLSTIAVADVTATVLALSAM